MRTCVEPLKATAQPSPAATGPRERAHPFRSAGAGGETVAARREWPRAGGRGRTPPYLQQPLAGLSERALDPALHQVTFGVTGANSWAIVEA